MNLFLRSLFLGAVCLLPLVGCSDDDNTSEGGGSIPPSTTDFNFETLELNQGALKVKITPQNDKMTYFFGVLEKSAFNTYEDPAKLQAENNEKIRELAESNGVGLEEFLMEALLSGIQEWRYNTLKPETDYVFYAYGLSTELEILSTVNSFEFRTPAVEPVEVTFKITATDVTPTSFTLNLDPDREDCAYYYDILLPSAYQDFCGGNPDNVPAFVENYLKELKATDKYASLDLPQFIAAITSTGKTADSSFKNLLPEGTYYAFAVCVANDGTCISQATVEMIQTGESPRNTYSVSDEKVSDVGYSALVTVEQNETYAAMMELREYFSEAKTDSDIIQMLYDAHRQNISQYLHAESDNVRFGGLIPNDNYYLLIFACNPDGLPKLGEKVNLKKVEVKTQAAKMSEAKYSLKVADITKTGAKVTVVDEKRLENETFLLNYITKVQYNEISGDKTEGLKSHMNAFIDGKLKEWNEGHTSGPMSRKEFLSRALMNGAEDTFVSIPFEGLASGTAYYAYVIGLKADGTYTTAPVMQEFATIGDQTSLASLSFNVMAYGYEDKKEDLYMVWVYPKDAKEHYFRSFVEKDEWAGKTAEEIKELLKKSDYPNSSSYQVRVSFGKTWYGYSVAYDQEGLPTKVYKLQHTSPANTGEGFGLEGREVKVEIKEL